jgi:hypothetical protein
MKRLQELTQEYKEPQPKDLPMVLILKRKSVRVFPSGKKVALYHNDKLGLDIAVPYNDSEVAATVKEDVLLEKLHDDLFGEYTEALKKHYKLGSSVDHPELAKMKSNIIRQYGKTAHGHMHAAAEHYLNGNIALASRNYARFERQIDEEFSDVVEADLTEAVLHKLHSIMKTKTDGEVVFANGSRHKVSHPQAAHIMKLHTLLTPENKVAVEKLMNTPAGIKKIADFAAEHLEGKK